MIEREVRFHLSAASVDAIQRAGYRMSDRLSIELEVEVDGFRCALHVKTDDVDEADEAVRDFRTHVLDEVLRARIREETTQVRNVILSVAFSRSGLVSHD